MKTSTVRRACHFRLKLPAYGGSYYVKKAFKLEAALARKPTILRIEMIGDGEIPADTALLIRSILVNRSPRRGDRLLPCWKKSLNGEASTATENGLPLLGGEGWGEGERFPSLNGWLRACFAEGQCSIENRQQQ